MNTASESFRLDLSKSPKTKAYGDGGNRTRATFRLEEGSLT